LVKGQGSPELISDYRTQRPIRPRCIGTIRARTQRKCIYRHITHQINVTKYTSTRFHHPSFLLTDPTLFQYNICCNPKQYKSNNCCHTLQNDMHTCTSTDSCCTNASVQTLKHTNTPPPRNAYTLLQNVSKE